MQAGLPANANADGAPQAHAVSVGKGHEHRGFVGEDAQVVKPASGTQDGLVFNSFDDAETVVRVNNLVANLKCHVSPVR